MAKKHKMDVEHPYKRDKKGVPVVTTVEWEDPTFTTTAKDYKLKYKPIHQVLASRSGSNELQKLTKSREKWLVMVKNVEFIPEVEKIRQDIDLPIHELRNMLEDKVNREMAKVIYWKDRKRTAEEKKLDQALEVRDEKISSLEEQMEALRAENEKLRKGKNGSNPAGNPA